MAAHPGFSEDDLEAALRRQPRHGLALLHEHFGLLVARYLKRVTWGLLSPEDLQDAYQETLRAVMLHVSRPGFQPERPLRLVFALARRKGVDALRRRGHQVRTDVQSVLECGAADLVASRVGAVWRERMGPAEAAEFREVLLEIVQSLPERQRLVARVFIDHFEDFGRRDTYEPLAASLSVVTGQPENVQAVKSAWRAARGKIAAELARRGYDLAGGSDRERTPAE
jgi:DNA-directed RNA polymerase specialized sigma24 family protein